MDSTLAIRRYLDEGGILGISGASGSGKSSFAHRLCDELGGTMHREGVREWLASHGNPRYADLPADRFAELQYYLLDCFEKSGATVWDRTPLDAIVYARRVSDRIDFETFRSRARAILERLHVLVFFPAHSDFLINDGVRIPDFMHQFETASRMFIEALDLNMENKLFLFDHCLTSDENIAKLSAFVASFEKSRASR